MKKILVLALALVSASTFAQKGGLDPATLSEISKGYEGSAADKAIRNALNSTPLATLAKNSERSVMIDTHFSDIIETKGRTNQKSSGRCWLFTGLNVLRASAIERFDLGEFQFSQNFCFFYDQLEKANLFLQAVIDTRDKGFDDRTVDWLFSHPISDGGTFTGVADLVTKYGVVPAEIFPETLSSNSTSAIRGQLSNILRQDGLALRDAGKKADLQKMKVEMLKEVYRILALTLGVPPTEFEWTRRDAKGNAVSTKTYTPLEFYKEFVGYDLQNNYIMVMNDPCREYGKVYEIEYDRHTYDGHNWLYVNLPLERIKEMAIASIKGGDAMYFSCDVGKFLDRERGIADINNFDYESLLGVKFTMDKKQRVQTHASGSSHAMTLIAVDLKDGKPQKWMVENSWGNTGWKGNIIMTDEWFNEYMFRLVLEKKYVPADIQAMLNQKPVKLPAWDPMFLGEE
ncbi:MAG: C1 family peptidase [Bacteroidales bacterium]|nr:C1 family peptidase [Bacteroidales bacterium]MBQ9310731.1 C1 family peptidase [Bacteroidales bacterium]